MSFPEQDRAVQILEKEFGPRWKQIVQELGTKELRQRVGKELTSFMAFPERGSGGNNKWRGNCSPEVVRAILRYVLECKHYYGKQTQDFTLLDPMSGSGTSQAAAQSLGVRSLLYDLNPAPACGIGGWDALRDAVVLPFYDERFHLSHAHKVMLHRVETPFGADVPNQDGKPAVPAQGHKELLDNVIQLFHKLGIAGTPGKVILMRRAPHISGVRDQIMVGRVEKNQI